MKPIINFIRSTSSTNNYLTARAATIADGEAVAAYAQTSGRGQRGNSWESAPGQNLTLSVMIRPENLDITRAFPLSEAVAMAAVGLLDKLLDSVPEKVAVKWPNDIYVGDRKIAGILIENSLSGKMISRSVAGIGININQPQFFSDAPNPVSLFQLTGEQLPIPVVAATFMRELSATLSLMQTDPPALHDRYMSRLWRGSGIHPFREAASGRLFEAAVTSIAPSGFITLTDTANARHTYAFKEIEWL